MAKETSKSALPYVILLSGTHVTGKETLAISLSQALNVQRFKTDMAHSAAFVAARSQAKKGYDFGEVFDAFCIAKLRGLGFNLESSKSMPASPPADKPTCEAVLTCFAMRKNVRDAIRASMLECDVRVVFVILHITPDTLSGRTLGAEEPELAKRIMADKTADVEEPQPDEKDIILVDSLQDVDATLQDIIGRVRAMIESI